MALQTRNYKTYEVRFHKGDHTPCQCKCISVPEDWKTEDIAYAAQTLTDCTVLDVKLVRTTIVFLGSI